MRCSTCGEDLREHEGACPTCGAVVSSPPVMRPMGLDVRSCARCGHVGTGVEYFRRPVHIALLLAVSIPTSGLGGIVYFLARRNHQICGQCGLGWEKSRIPGPGFAGQAAFANSPGTDLVGLGAGFNTEARLPRRGVGRRVLGVAMVLLAGLMVTIGVVDFVVEAIAMGSVMGASGTGMIWWGIKARDDRRRALMSRLQRRVLLLATEKGGMLTVTEVAASLDLSLSAAEGVLEDMDDGLRVRSDVTDQGIIVYEFPEVRHHPRLETGSAG